MSRKLFIGREHEVSLLEKAFRPTGIPHRTLLLIAGPRGIGKTATTLHVLDRLKRDNVLTIYLCFDKLYTSSRNAIADVINQFMRLGGEDYSIESLIDKGYSPTGLLQELVETLVKTISGVGVEAVIVFDELQNILDTKRTSLRGLMKFLTTLQERYGYLQFILITSNYSFLSHITIEAHMGYIDIFYLGEMSREDTLELVTKLLGYNRASKVQDLEIAVNAIGGNPGLAYRLVNHSIKYGIPLARSLEYLERQHYNATLRKIELFRKSRGEHTWSLVAGLLRELCRQPLSLEDIDTGLMESVNWFIEHGILQLSCREYLGIYKWNKQTCGGLCSLDLIAPSNRLYL